MVILHIEKEVSLKEARVRLGLNEIKASEAAGITINELIQYEETPGEVPVSIALTLANIYQRTVDTINFN
ncbi:hypothetical protein MKX41_31080 [Paenibacillus sp. FSL R5-0475]|uniref:hypothetical protein n=1 Tax=Paenibacillus sp. FSL R5-0475 TaxID=2921643 RepID=UPI0030F5137B